MGKKLEIIYEDDELVFVNKPSGMLSIPDRYAVDLPNVYNLLQRKFGEIFPVHRLDRETSGLICFAKNEVIHKSMNQLFQKREVGKYYYVLVNGVMNHDEGTIDKPIAQNKMDSSKMIIAKRGKESTTLYRVLERFKDVTVVEAQIKTGRTHQIRVHFEALGYPLLVDKVYGKHTEFLVSSLKGRKFKLAKGTIEKPLLDRTSLHAHRLVFTHPSSSKKIEVIAPLPKDIAAVVKQLRKWGSN